MAGGAQRKAAVMRVSCRMRPSSRCLESGELANPNLYRAPNSQSALRSPVNIRPVRLPPWAAGASPTINKRACGSPKAGRGLPQYSQLLYMGRRFKATSSR